MLPFAPTVVPARFRDLFLRAEHRLLREIAVKSAWVVLVLSIVSNGTILIRGSSLVDIAPMWNLLFRGPTPIICIGILLLHYCRAPGVHWPLVTLRLLSFSAMWAVFGLLVFAYEQGGEAFRTLSELSILGVFCVALVSLRGVPGCVIPLFLPLAGLFAALLYRGHEPLTLVLDLLTLVSAVVIATLFAHVQFQIRVREFVSRHELNELSTIDTLTGLMNRRAMTERLEAERARCRHYNRTFAAILMDLDHFKQVNIRYGQRSGDAVLREVARRLKGHTRQQDCVARWSGEVFLIFLPETDEKGAMAAAEKLKVALQKSPIDLGTHGAHQQTCSFGVAIYDGREEITRLVARADQALHMAKECGRNRAVMA